MGLITSLIVGYLLVGSGFAMGRKSENKRASFLGLSIVAWPIVIKEWLS